jgi:hypothetical protein
MNVKVNSTLFIMQALGIAVLHFMVTFFLGFATGVGTLKSFWVGLVKVLTFPLSVIPGTDNPWWLGWLAWVLLSLIWGFAIAYIMRRFARSRG